MKKFHLVLGFMLIMLLAMSTNLMAANQVVTSNADDGGGPLTTLREAIAAVGDGEEITFNLSAGNETITLASQLTINKNLSIDGDNSAGSGIDVTIQANADPNTATYGVFSISSGTVTISDMTIRNGNSGSSGNGIANYATLTLTNCTISGNSSTNWGAGIYNNGSLTMNSCTVSGNTSSTGNAGGINNNGGTITMDNCTVSENTAEYNGGGIYNDDGTITMENCTISGNDCEDYGYGGGIYNSGSSATLTMTNCTVSGNKAIFEDCLGGGFYNQDATITLTNCTISGNQAGVDATSDGGGGYYFYSGTLNIKNTIIANNTDGGGDTDYYYYAGTLTDNGYNVVEYSNVGATATGGFDNANDILYNTKNGDAGTSFTSWTKGGTVFAKQNLYLSSTLDLNNNPNGTETLTYTNGSSIGIDDGTNTGTPATDQRGASIYNSTKDIGAYEWQGSEGTLPVVLSSFTAQYINDTPTLCWTTQSEASNVGWNIYRGETNEALSNEEAYQLNLSLGLIPGAGTTSEPTDYNFEDVFPIYQGTTYYYWLESVDYSGESEIYGPISLTIPEDEWENPNSPEIPKNYGLHQNYPNPFNPNTEISFIMKESCIAELSVYNIKGEKISTLFRNKSVSKDELIRANWDGKDDLGKAVSSGIYLYKLRTNKEDFVHKMILMK
ncbi:MAG: T9SS type A sorting domain-containing protein [Armatimonadetes bacterium]|nr:T9SS type A sorting domain-containing protein [Armatimonadota bacterium]